MGTLGKVLLFVNLLAAAALTYFAAQDWTKRLEVSSTALRYVLVTQGLPVESASKAGDDDVQLDLALSGGQTAGTVRKSLLVSHFQGSAGDGEFSGDPAGPPVNQKAELDRVKQKLDAKLASFGGAAERLAYLCGTLSRGGTPTFTPGLLARLAVNYDERDAVVRLATGADAEAAVARAKELLDAKFAAAATVNAQQAAADATAVKAKSEDVKKAAADADAAFKKYQADLQAAQVAYEASPKGPADVQSAKAAYEAAAAGREPARQALTAALTEQGKAAAALGTTASRDAGDQRRRIARLLSEVDPGAGWQKRVALVVGLRTYREALGEQVDRLRDQARAAQAQAVSDQAEFTESYLVLRQQAFARTLLLEQQQRATADLVAQQAKEREATALRRAQFVKRQEELAAVRAEVNTALAEQSKVEAELFNVQKQVGDTLRLNFDLERQLQQAEYKAQGK